MPATLRPAFAARSCVIAVLLAGALSPTLSRSAPQGVDLDPLRQLIERVRAQDRIPGVALALIEQGQVSHTEGFGDACRGTTDAPVNGNTPFILGSMSKLFTAIAVMQLVERQSQRLDQAIQEILPWFRVADGAAGAKITVRQLLHHTSGLPRITPMADANRPLADHVRLLAEVELWAPPGTGHKYSSANYQVLGAIVQARSGLDFGRYVQEHIIAPLGLKHTSTQGLPRTPEAACGHRYWAGVPLSVDLPHEVGRLPTASMVSSAADLARVLSALMGGGQTVDGARILSPASAARLVAPAARIREGLHYAMGLRVGPIHGVSALHHGGVLNHFRGKWVILPGSRQAVVVLTNASSHLGRMSSHVLANALAARLAGRKPAGFALPLKYFLGAVAAGLLLLLLSMFNEVRKLGQWTEALPEKLGGSRLGRVRLLATAVFNVLLPPVVLIGVPAATGMSWSQLIGAMPDMGWWCLVYLSLSLVLAVVKGGRVVGGLTAGDQ